LRCNERERVSIALPCCGRSDAKIRTSCPVPGYSAQLQLTQHLCYAELEQFILRHLLTMFVCFTSCLQLGQMSMCASWLNSGDTRPCTQPSSTGLWNRLHSCWKLELTCMHKRLALV